MPDLSDLLNPELLTRIIQQSQQPTPQHIQPDQPQTNHYGVPIVYTEPDVVLQGRLRMEVTFKHADIVGKTHQQLLDLTYAVINGNRGPGLPEVKTGLLELYQEVQKRAATQEADDQLKQRIITEFLTQLGGATESTGVRISGPASDIRGIGDAVPGTPDLLPTGGSRPPDDHGVSDIHHHVVPVADDRQRHAGKGIGTRLANKPRTHRPKRQATEDPIVPQAELDSRVVEDFIDALAVDDHGHPLGPEWDTEDET